MPEALEGIFSSRSVYHAPLRGVSRGTGCLASRQVHIAEIKSKISRLKTYIIHSAGYQSPCPIHHHPPPLIRGGNVTAGCARGYTHCTHTGCFLASLIGSSRFTTDILPSINIGYQAYHKRADPQHHASGLIRDLRCR